MAQPPHHELNLADVWIRRFRAERRPNRPSDPAAPTARARILPVVVGEGALSFDCAISVRVRIPGPGDEIFDGTAELVGRFVAETEVDEARAGAFARASALFLLWPYARTSLDDAARTAGVEGPPLPLLVRPRGGHIDLPQPEDG